MDEEIEIALEAIQDVDPRSFLEIVAEQVAFGRNRDVANGGDVERATELVSGINQRRALVGLAPIQ